MKIITISREFGSGGRELGRCLASALGSPCFDKEIINEVASKGIDTSYVNYVSDVADIKYIYPLTIGRTFHSPFFYDDKAIRILTSQQNVIRNLAQQGDAVFIGRYADIILKDLNPINIFVYADKQSKLKRCLEHIREGETENSILKQMKKIDNIRKSNQKIFTDMVWGAKENYHLCINTSGMKIEEMVPFLVEFVNSFPSNQ